MYTAKYEAVFLATIVKNKELLIALLESILKIKIDELTILNAKLIKDKIKSKSQNLDLLIKNNNKYINVELNTNNNVVDRNLLYAFKVAVDTALKGNNYKFDNETIQINFNFGKSGKNEAIEEYYIYNKVSDITLTKKFKIIHINIDKVKEMYYNDNKKFILEYAPVIMLDLDLKELSKLSKESKIVSKYKKVLEIVNNDEKIVKWISEDIEAKNYEEAMKEYATEDGLKQGLEQGIEQTKIEMAKKMIEQNYSFEDISKITDLSIEEINFIS